jgi:hypothetical protein
VGVGEEARGGGVGANGGNSVLVPKLRVDWVVARAFIA